jgi:hypothetical protein
MTTQHATTTNEAEHSAGATGATGATGGATGATGAGLADQLGALDDKIKKHGGQGLAELLSLVANQFLGVPR